MANNFRSVLVSFALVLVTVFGVGCTGPDGDEEAVAADTGKGGSAAAPAAGGSTGHTPTCADVDCNGGSCSMVDGKPKCSPPASGGSGGSGGSNPGNPCNTAMCGDRVCDVQNGQAICVDKGKQQIDIVPNNGCRAVLFDESGTEVANSSNGEVHEPVDSAWQGWAMLTVQCGGAPYKSDWTPVGANATSTGAFSSIKVNGVEVKDHSLICKDKYSDPSGSKGWKKIAVPMSSGNWDKCP